MNKFNLKNLLFVALIIFLTNMKTNAQEEINPVIWSVETRQNQDSTRVIAQATIEPGWHVYSQVISDDPEAMGPIPLTFTIEPNDGIQVLGDTQEKSEMITHFDKAFEIDLNYYEHELILEQPIKVTSNSEKIRGSISYMACDDERCIFPPEFTFELKIND